jgi:hypothetical protein
MGSPQLSDLGDSTSYREEPIHIEISAKEPSAAARRFADVIRFKQACEGEMKMYGDDEQYREELKAAKKQWLEANNLYKQLLQERSSVTGDHVVEEPREDPSSQFHHSSLQKLVRRPKKRRRVVVDDSDEDLPALSSSNVLEDGLYRCHLRTSHSPQI